MNFKLKGKYNMNKDDPEYWKERLIELEKKNMKMTTKMTGDQDKNDDKLKKLRQENINIQRQVTEKENSLISMKIQNENLNMIIVSNLEKEFQQAENLEEEKIQDYV